MRLSYSTAVAVTLVASVAQAQVSPYSIASPDDIKQSATTLAYDLMSYYTGNLSGQTVGILPGPPPVGPYYWWEGGALWGTMIDYWFYTGDTTYNDVVTAAILHQTGDNFDFMPLNWTASLGNDDQGFWGLTAMLAAENKFPDPPASQPQWLSLAQAVFNTQAAPNRHDGTCGGGIRWQIPFANKGYDYKNTIANGVFFNLGARLARCTNNQTYAVWATSTWDWLIQVKFINNETYQVYDGGHVEYNCTDVNKAQFSYNSAIYMEGCAYMYNYTGESIWLDRTLGLMKSCLKTFFPNDTAYEPSCEPYNGQCTTDMLSFKGYVHRWLTTLTKMAPATAATILPVLEHSTQAAINQCTGPPTGRACGFRWSTGKFDPGYGTGAGQQMNVLGAVSSLLIKQVAAQVTADTGGTSKGNPNAGSNSNTFTDTLAPVTLGDRVGAGLLTFVLLASAIGTFSWMSVGS